MSWNIVYYETSNGNIPVFEFIQKLDPKSKSRVIELLDTLSDYGINLGLPHSKKLTGTKIWELRILNPKNIRIFYVAVVDKKFLLLHGFIKKKQKTDRREIKIAEERLLDYIAKL